VTEILWTWVNYELWGREKGWLVLDVSKRKGGEKGDLVLGDLCLGHGLSIEWEGGKKGWKRDIYSEMIDKGEKEGKRRVNVIEEITNTRHCLGEERKERGHFPSGMMKEKTQSQVCTC